MNESLQRQLDFLDRKITEIQKLKEDLIKEATGGYFERARNLFALLDGFVGTADVPEDECVGVILSGSKWSIRPPTLDNGIYDGTKEIGEIRAVRWHPRGFLTSVHFNE